MGKQSITIKVTFFHAVFCLLALSALASLTAYAQPKSPNWLIGDADYISGATFNDKSECKNEVIAITGIRSRIYVDNSQYTNHGAYTEQSACVYHAGGYSYAQYRRDYYAVPSWPALGSFPEAMVAVSIGQSTSYTPAEGFGDKDSTTQLYLGVSSSFIQHGSMDSGFRFYRDLPSHLSLQEGDYYALDDNPDFRYSDASGNQLPVDGIGISLNKQHISFGVRNFGIMVYDVRSSSTLRVSDRYYVSSATWPVPVLSTSVSDDGSYVVVGGTAYQTEVIDSKDCGSWALPTATPTTYNLQPLGLKECRYRDFTETTISNSLSFGGNGMRVLTRLQMSASGDMFTYWDNYKWSTIYAPNYLKPGQMYYMALGDSYASGDGDISIDGVDHYYPGTNIYGDYTKGIPRETCHQSLRSYSMQLATAMQLTKGIDMQTVACSGAVVDDVLSTKLMSSGYVNPNYLGQPTQLIRENGPRLLGAKNAAQLQEQARADYTPGRVQQIELVKKAQPKYLTLMAGGNDIDFPGFMMACAKNTLPSISETCDYAQGEGLAGEAKKVYDLYPKLVDFYRALKKVSASTTIYVMGYPQFMDENNESCSEMLDLYSKPERVAIHGLIAYANAVIRSAALDAGARYIDVDDALAGEKLCAEGTGMTGITDVLASTAYTAYMKSLTMSDSTIAKHLNTFPAGALYQAALSLYIAEQAENVINDYIYSPATILADITQELSHPNAVGHRAIFNKIKTALGDDLLDSISACDSPLVSCPLIGVNIGRPNVNDYFPMLSLRTDTVYVSGNNKVSVGRTDASDKTTIGALAKSAVGQFVRISADLIEEVNFTKPIIMELHSIPVQIGSMNQLPDGSIEGRVVVPSTVAVGLHILHVKGVLTDGRAFDVDKPVFVEGPLGDVDGDGIGDLQDSCAFGHPSGIDVDVDGIDDACDFSMERVQTGPGATIVKPELRANDGTQLSAQKSNVAVLNHSTGLTDAVTPSSKIGTDSNTQQNSWFDASKLIALILLAILGAVIIPMVLSRRA